MRHTTLKFAFVLGATLLLTNCGKKNFNQDLAQASASASAPNEGVGQIDTPPSTNPPSTNPPVTNPPHTAAPATDPKDVFAQDACISTIQWYDGFNWFPYTSDQDCISKMKTLIRAQTGDLSMMNFEIRHVTKEQLQAFKAQAPKLDQQFVSLVEKQTTPIYGFYDGWINL